VAAEEIIGLDIGAVRTGIARASTAARLAEPVRSVETEDLSDELRKLGDQGVQRIVVGLPRNLSGDDTNQTDWIRQLVESLKTELPKLAFYLQDEALTTVAAEAKGKKVTDVDAEAAAIILQDFLDSEEVR
jgi:putative Holliday junction resolvase